MAKAKKAVVIKKKQEVQKAPKIKVVPNKVQKKVPEVKKVEAKAKKVQPKIIQPKAKKEKPKVQKVEPKVKKAQPKIVQSKVKKEKPKDEKVNPKPEIKQSLDVHDFQPIPLIPIKLTNAIIQNIPIEVKVKDEQQLNVSEMTIKEIMIQKNLSYEGAISFIKNNQPK